MLLRVLIVSRTPGRSERLTPHLDKSLALIRRLADGEDLRARLRRDVFDLVLIDDQLLVAPTPSIEEIRGLPDGTEVVVLAEDPNSQRRAALQASGSFAVVDPEVAAEDLAGALAAILQRRSEQLRRQLNAHDPEGNRLSDFATASPAMREFLDLAQRVTQTDSTLLVQGETGVGKEYLSRAIHAEGARAAQPFVAVNCSALSETLLESELFGHVEGAFTGATRSRRGYIELAHGGSLFLDEIGELTPTVQVKLLRVLQNQRIQPVGAEEEVQVDVRLIAATNRDLMREMQAGRFRADLFYRLSVVTLQVPPLSLRREDIPSLVESHVESFRFSLNRPVYGIEPDALQRLVDYAWPGNVRELINVMERTVLLCAGQQITVADLPARIGSPADSNEAEPDADEQESEPLRDDLMLMPYSRGRQELLDRFDRQYLESILTRSHGRIGDGAKLSGLNTRSLYEKMRRVGIKKEFFRLR